MRNLTNHFLKFLRLSISEKRLFMEAVFFLFSAKIILLLFPFKFCLKLLASDNPKSEHRSPEYLQGIKTAIARANCLAFWKNVCLVQSFAARWMLNRRGINSKLSIGVAHDENKNLKAHAWVTAGEVELVSGNSDFLGIYFLN